VSASGATAAPLPLERIQEKWAPVFRPNGRPNKDGERIQEKWAPVFRPNARQNKDSEHVRDAIFCQQRALDEILLLSCP